MSHSLDRTLLIEDLNRARGMLTPQVLYFVEQQSYNPLMITQENYMILNSIHDEILIALGEENESVSR